MPTQVTKKIDFTGKQLFIGLDVHKKSWSVTIIVDGTEHRTFTKPPDPESLSVSNWAYYFDFIKYLK